MFLHVCEADFDDFWYREPDSRWSYVFACLGAKNGCRNENVKLIFVRAMSVPMAIHSHWHIHCRSRAHSHSHGHRQSYGARALGLSHSDCHRRCHGNGVATANDNGRGTGHAVAVAMAKARGLAMILMTFYAISVIFLLRQRQFSAKFKCFRTPIDFDDLCVAATTLFGKKKQMLFNAYRIAEEQKKS